MTDTATPAPTVSSNSQAAHRACGIERERVLKILATAPQGVVPDSILEAIAAGTPAAVFATNQRVRAKAAASVNAARTRPTDGSGKWDAITSQFKTQRPAVGKETDTEGSAT